MANKVATPVASKEIPKAPDKSEALAMLNPLVRRAESFQVVDEISYQKAWDGVQKIDKFLEWWKGKTSPLVTALHAAHKAACKLRDEFLPQAEAAKKLLLKKRLDYKDKVDKANREEADRQSAALAKQQEKELEKTAKKLEKQGETEAAAEIREIAKTAPPPMVAPVQTLARNEGSAILETWKAEVIEGQEHLVPRELCSPDMKLINTHIKLYKDRKQVPGVKIWLDRKEISRTSKAS